MPEMTKPGGDLEQVGVVKPSLDLPPEAFAPSADVLTDEVDPPLDIIDKGFGPVKREPALSDEEMEALEATDDTRDEEPETKPEEDDEPPPQDASEKGDDVKESPEAVPYERFQEVIQENQRLKQAAEVLDWITKNPEQAAAKLGAKAAPRQVMPEQKNYLDVSIDEPTSSKSFDDMSEEEKAELMVQKISHGLFKEPLEKIMRSVNDLLNFKEQLGEALTKNAVDVDGKLLHPRWDELRGAMSEVKSRYPGMSDAEAYHLADKMIPLSTPMQDEMAQYNAPVPPQAPRAERPEPPAKPKRASPKAARAAKVASFGRSSPGMTSTSDELMSAEDAAGRAFDEILETGLGPT